LGCHETLIDVMPGRDVIGEQEETRLVLWSDDQSTEKVVQSNKLEYSQVRIPATKNEMKRSRLLLN
jgi:hypothetical protein